MYNTRFSPCSKYISKCNLPRPTNIESSFWPNITIFIHFFVLVKGVLVWHTFQDRRDTTGFEFGASTCFFEDSIVTKFYSFEVQISMYNIWPCLFANTKILHCLHSTRSNLSRKDIICLFCIQAHLLYYSFKKLKNTCHLSVSTSKCHP